MQCRPRLTEFHYTGDYLALEASSNVKHEFLDGQIYAMAGGTLEHATLAAAVVGLLFSELRGSRCRAYDADLRVRTPSGLATYPDVTIVCGPSERDPVDEQAVTNPTLIVEIPSRSTEFERELEEEMRLHVQLRAERLGDLDAARREAPAGRSTRSSVDASGRHVTREPGFSETFEEVVHVV